MLAEQHNRLPEVGIAQAWSGYQKHSLFEHQGLHGQILPCPCLRCKATLMMRPGVRLRFIQVGATVLEEIVVTIEMLVTSCRGVNVEDGEVLLVPRGAMQDGAP